MQQVIQDLAKRKVRVAEVPDPVVRPGHVLIATSCSVISAGTERHVVQLGKKSLLGKARARPDLVKQVLLKLKSEGLINTLDQVGAKLKEAIPLGYSSCGTVLAVGDGVRDLRPGERVASNGPHAGLVCVPQNLCARVPEGVSDEAAAFTVLGAIALQGVRLARLGLGDSALVIGLGLVGQLAVKLLQAQGCRVLGTDPSQARCRLVPGAVTRLTPEHARDFTGGHGFDAVLICASTPSSEPVETAGEVVRQRGRVVVVGAVGMTLPRQPYYLKEAEFVVSCSYGPGRYDPVYEERGRDYPYGFVRWTEQRNMQAVLELMRSGQLPVDPLINRRFPIERAEEAYDLLEQAPEDCLGIVLDYPERPPRPVVAQRSFPRRAELKLGVIGSGQFARLVILPILARLKGLRLGTLCSVRPTGADLGFEEVTADEDLAIANADAVVIVTRHDRHADQVVKALKAGKHVFVEKPLALSEDELAQVEEAMRPELLLMVGFNRRFSPLAQHARTFFQGLQGPRTCSIRFNAGYLSPDHWTRDPEVGGGRLIGEACHAIDLATYLVGSPPARIFAESVAGAEDQCFMTLRHADGSASQIAYLAGGHPAFPKERVELLGGGRMAVIDDFRSLQLSDGSTRKAAQDKGHRAELEAFAGTLLQGGPPPIPWEELRAVSLAAIRAGESLREGVPLPCAE